MTNNDWATIRRALWTGQKSRANTKAQEAFLRLAPPWLRRRRKVSDMAIRISRRHPFPAEEVELILHKTKRDWVLTEFALNAAATTGIPLSKIRDLWKAGGMTTLVRTIRESGG